MTEKATPQFVKRAQSVSVTALYTIVQYHHLSASSPNFWNEDDRKSDTSICQKSMKCLSDSFIYDCWISSFVRIFTEYLKWRWQEKQHLNLSKGHEVFQWHLYIRLLNIINCQDLHQLFEMEMTGKTTTSICQEHMKSFSNSFIYDCCISSVVMIFVEYLKRSWQQSRHLNFSKGR